MFLALLLTTPSLPETGSYHGFAHMGRNKSRLGALILPADRFKQPFESLSVAFMYAASNAPGFEVDGCIGGRYGTPLTGSVGAFDHLSALPRGLDLGAPTFNPLPCGRR